MSLQRYYHDIDTNSIVESPNGEWIQLDDVIKLLEAYAETYLTTKEAIERELCEDWHTGIADAIALIKGEQK